MADMPIGAGFKCPGIKFHIPGLCQINFFSCLAYKKFLRRINGLIEYGGFAPGFAIRRHRNSNMFRVKDPRIQVLQEFGADIVEGCGLSKVCHCFKILSFPTLPENVIIGGSPLAIGERTLPVG